MTPIEGNVSGQGTTVEIVAVYFVRPFVSGAAVTRLEQSSEVADRVKVSMHAALGASSKSYNCRRIDTRCHGWVPTVPCQSFLVLTIPFALIIPCRSSIDGYQTRHKKRLDQSPQPPPPSVPSQVNLPLDTTLAESTFLSLFNLTIPYILIPASKDRFAKYCSPTMFWNSLHWLLAALPVLALAQSSTTVTISSQVITVTLPSSMVQTSVITSVTSSAVATFTSTISAAASSVASPPTDGVTIPITLEGYITTVVLPYWPSASHPSAPLTTSTLPAAVPVLSAALSSAQSSVSSVSSALSVVSSYVAAASQGI